MTLALSVGPPSGCTVQMYRPVGKSWVEKVAEFWPVGSSKSISGKNGGIESSARGINSAAPLCGEIQGDADPVVAESTTLYFARVGLQVTGFVAEERNQAPAGIAYLGTSEDEGGIFAYFDGIPHVGTAKEDGAAGGQGRAIFPVCHDDPGVVFQAHRTRIHGYIPVKIDRGSGDHQDFFAVKRSSNN